MPQPTVSAREIIPVLTQLKYRFILTPAARSLAAKALHFSDKSLGLKRFPQPAAFGAS
jgi:hypothetical protein